MKEIIFATKNKGKLKEIKHMLDDIFIVKGLDDINIDIDIEEDGNTFEENAIKKAKEINKITNTIVLADDSGLEIDYLDKAPGIHSARYMGYDTPYNIKNEAIIKKLEGVSKEKRTARFVSVIALATNDICITTKGTIEGVIAQSLKGTEGFGYDPIFYIEKYNKTMAEISIEEKNKISHRYIAMEKMKNELLRLRGEL